MTSVAGYAGDKAEQPRGCLDIVRRYMPGGMLMGTLWAFIGTGIGILIRVVKGW
jgi:hypothetical protein